MSIKNPVTIAIINNKVVTKFRNMVKPPKIILTKKDIDKNKKFNLDEELRKYGY